MPIVNSFFGCTDLITGGQILGWITIIFRGIFLLICLVCMGMSSIVKEYAKKVTKNDKNKGITEEEIENIVQISGLISTNYTTGFALLSFLTSVGLIIAILFLMGVKQKRYTYIIPYIIFDVLSVLLWFCNWISSLTNLASCLFNGIIFGVSVYLFLFAIAVFQHIKELETNIQSEAYDAQQLASNPNYSEAPPETPPLYENIYPKEHMKKSSV